MSLDQVVARLEAVALKLAGGSSSSVPPAVEFYEAFFKGTVQKFIDTAEKQDSTKKIAAWTTTAFSHLGQTILASTECAKPADDAFLKFLDPIVQIISSTSNPDNRSANFNFEKAFGEAIQGMSWVMLPGPKDYIVSQLEASQLYLNKILTVAKDKADPEKTITRDFVKEFKEVFTGLAEYAGENFKTGLIWKFKGADLASWKPGAGAGASKGPSSVEERLHEVTAKLEAYAAKKVGGGDSGVPAAVAEYDAYFKNSVEPLIAAASALPGGQKIADWTKAAFEHQAKVVKASTECKKPSDETLLKYLDPIVKVINDSSNPGKGDLFNHEKAFGEAIQGLSWIMMPGGGKAYVESQLEAGQLYLNKVLVTAKDLQDPDKTNHRTYVSAIKKAFADLAEFVNEHFKTGVVWKANGKDLA